jgi:peptidylprolyl isomerase
MAQQGVKAGDRVKVHYRGWLEDGTVFDSSQERDPFEFVVGERRVISGFEDAVVGMSQGDTKTLEIAPENGYGPHRKELIFDVDKSRFPADLDLSPGARVQARSEAGTVAIMTVTGVNGASVTLDGNHPLTGRTLNFEIRLEEIVISL